MGRGVNFKRGGKMVQSVHLEKQNIIIIYVETQNDYERALKYLAGTKYEVVPYDDMARTAKGDGNILVIGSKTIKV